MKKKIRKISMIFALKIYFEGQFSQNFDWGSYSLWTSLRGLTSTIQLRINSFHIVQALIFVDWNQTEKRSEIKPSSLPTP